jgi:outer membrane protein TolC
MAFKRNLEYKVHTLTHTYSKLGVCKKIGSLILNPKVVAKYSGVEYPPQYFSPKGYAFVFFIEQPVLDISLYANILESKFEKDVYKELKEEAKSELSYLVESAYLNVLKTQELVKLKKEAIIEAEENMKVVQKKIEIGEASMFDSLTAEVYIRRSKLNYLRTCKDYEKAKEKLLSLIGISNDCELLLEPVKLDTTYKFPSLDTLVIISLENRHSIKASGKKLRQSQISFYKSLFSLFPKLTFKWSWANWMKEFPDNFSELREGGVESSGWEWDVGIGLFIYPFEIWQAKTNIDKNKQLLLKEKLNVLSQIKTTWLEGKESLENIKLAKAMLSVAEEANRLAKTQYELGIISALDLFRANIERLNAESSYIKSMYDYLIVRAKIQFITGGNYSDK